MLSQLTLVYIKIDIDIIRNWIHIQLFISFFFQKMGSREARIPRIYLNVILVVNAIALAGCSVIPEKVAKDLDKPTEEALQVRNCIDIIWMHQLYSSTFRYSNLYGCKLLILSHYFILCLSLFFSLSVECNFYLKCTEICRTKTFDPFLSYYDLLKFSCENIQQFSNWTIKKVVPMGIATFY